MKTFLRSVQTYFPFLHDLRFSVKFLVAKATRTPHEYDFNAVKLFKPAQGQVFVDIGSNRGESIVSMLLAPGLDCKLIGFEPNPLIFEKLKNHVSGNSRVEINNVGLSDSNGELVLFVPFYRQWMFDGLSSFHYDEAKDWLRNRLWRYDEKKLSIKKITCQVRTLDEFNLDPYFIKIDVQGHELAVLKGGVKTLEKSRPVILVESITDDIIRHLEPLGYQTYGYSEKGFTPGKGTLNTFCITPEKYADLVKG